MFLSICFKKKQKTCKIGILSGVEYSNETIDGLLIRADEIIR